GFVVATKIGFSSGFALSDARHAEASASNGYAPNVNARAKSLPPRPRRNSPRQASGVSAAQSFASNPIPDILRVIRSNGPPPTDENILNLGL
ncbi:MAG: hypothetical protein II180_03650, partial [Proteobacteria bacterium]|nr:hypothetical protein [Pseudomonadota bacterium]